MFRTLVLTHLFMSCLTTNAHQSFADGFVTFRLLSSFVFDGNTQIKAKSNSAG